MLITPILEKHSAFDVSTFLYLYACVGKGGDDFTKIRVTFKNNVTGVVMYQDEMSKSYSSVVDNKIRLECGYMGLPAKGLVNGGYYSAYVQTYNATDGWSAKSNSIQFSK